MYDSGLPWHTQRACAATAGEYEGEAEALLELLMLNEGFAYAAETLNRLRRKSLGCALGRLVATIRQFPDPLQDCTRRIVRLHNFFIQYHASNHSITITSIYDPTSESGEGPEHDPDPDPVPLGVFPFHQQPEFGEDAYPPFGQQLLVTPLSIGFDVFDFAGAAAREHSSAVVSTGEGADRVGRSRGQGNELTMKLRLLGGVVLAAAVTASGAWAEDGWYGAVDVGGHVAHPLDVTSPGEPGLSIKIEDNVIALVRLGYRISPNPRLEVEGGYRPGDLKGLATTGGNASYVCSPGSSLSYGEGGFSGTCGSPSGSVHAWTGMANAIVDVLPTSRFDPFFGGGVGVVHVKVRGSVNLVGPLAGDSAEPAAIGGSSTAFAYQAIAGVSYVFNDRLNLDLTFPYIAGERDSYGSSAGGGVASFSGRYEDQSVTLGVRYALSAPPPPPPPLPPPPPPSPAATPGL